MKKGSIKCYITKAVVQGEARVGKTSLKCALTKEKYVKTSTSGIEPSVAVRCYSGDSKSGQYELISLEEMRAKVRNAIRSQAKDKAAIDKVATDKVATDKVAADKVVTDDITAVSTNSQPQVLSKPSQEASEAITPASEASTLTNEASSVSVNNTKEIQNAIAIVNQFCEDCKKAQEEGKTLDSEHWLYFIDSGGQIQFQKLLPVFMPFASVLIVVVSLAKSLTAPSSAFAYYEGEDMKTESETLTVEEVLKQLFSSIVPSAFRYMTSLVNDPNHFKNDIKIVERKQAESTPNKLSRINIIFVATCGDKCTDVSVTCRLKEMQEKLNSIVKCHKEKCKCMPESKNYCISILEVDGRDADPDEVDKIPKDRRSTTKESLGKIAEVLDDNEYEFTVPLNWYCLDVLLHEKASEGCGILTLSFCQKIGQELGMSLPDEISNALKFLHLFNKILYYHNSKACSDLVFVEIKSLFNILKELVMPIYKCQPNVNSMDPFWGPLVCEGKLTIEKMEIICEKALNEKYNEKDRNEALTDFQLLKRQCKNPQFEEKLLKLFQELLIAAPLSPYEYFIPALLPLKVDTHVPHVPADPFPPLLFCFKDAVPMGLFCAVIVHLLSCHPRVKWELISDSKTNYSNYFALECAEDPTVKIILVEQVDHIALCCFVKDYRGIAREYVEEAITSATEKHKLDSNVYQKGFYCSCDDAIDRKHFAIFSKLKDTYVIECKKQNDSWMHWLTCEF